MSEAKNVEFEARVVAADDGHLLNPRFERVALIMAEGVGEIEAWKACGGTAQQGSRKYSRRVFANPVFKKRVAELSEERVRLEADDIWGEARWMANQLWRTASVAGDVRTMSEAAKLRFQLAEKMAAVAPAQSPAEESTQAKTPGRPAADSPQSKSSSIADIKSQLMRKNRKEPDLDADTEVEGEA